MTTYRQHYSTRQNVQSQPIPGRETDMVENNAGGYTFQVDDWKRLDRFLLLGSESGSYYVNEKNLTIDNAKAVERCIRQDGLRVVSQIIRISTDGRAVKNDPALFALAMCAGMGNLETRKAALCALPKVARIGTHLFHFAEYVEGFRGWGRGLREAVAKWYTDKPVDKLAYQVVKYQQRDGWSHRDLLRLAHPKTDEKSRNAVFEYVTKGEGDIAGNDSLLTIEGFERAKAADNKRQIVGFIDTYGLTREMIPSQWLNEPDVWAALLPKMPLTALVRNLGKITSIGLIKPMSQEAGVILSKLSDTDYIHKSRLHPLSVLVALKTYAQGAGMRGSLTWNPVREIVDALDEAFYMAFDNVDPTGKRQVLALDVSGSMWVHIAGMPISAREASAAMAMVTARVEKQYWILAFSDQLIEINVSPKQRLDDIVKTIINIPFGGTDCALPMLGAMKKNVSADGFIIYTDNETWAGNVHPVQALNQYRQKFVSDAKLVTVGMTSSGFTIADPNDAGMLDVVGFDTATPQVISGFLGGE